MSVQGCTWYQGNDTNTLTRGNAQRGIGLGVTLGRPTSGEPGHSLKPAPLAKDPTPATADGYIYQLFHHRINPLTLASSGPTNGMLPMLLQSANPARHCCHRCCTSEL